ncbi:MAG TPA: signal recognition particle subunit SRP19/SEC65 family protein [Thermoplasmata archaeon]|nr:signal recognition particle subunit SRP19/SEC65 family protein [Thermoplasmata archaeon]
MPDHFYVYPAYLGRGLSRTGGRRVPESESLPDLTAEEIVDAAKRLGFRAELESAKQYPRRFFDYSGRVKVTKKGGMTKARFLRQLAGEVTKQRAAAGRK